MDKLLSLKDIENMHDEILTDSIKSKLKCGPKKTRITIKDADTGEVLQVRENKVVISGSAYSASSMFGVDLPFEIPNYNTALGLDNSVPSGTTIPFPPIICLFGVADEGCGELDSDVFTVNYVDRIAPEHLIPFRYVDIDDDITDTERNIYFGRKTLTEDEKIAYYFKTFDNTPHIYLRYADGTEINPATMYTVESAQEAECFVQLDLLINRVDCREYFDQVIGWDHAKVSTVSLVFGWYTEDEGYRWYQQITPFTKLNFTAEKLVDRTKALAFEYALFF